MSSIIDLYVKECNGKNWIVSKVNLVLKFNGYYRSYVGEIEICRPGDRRQRLYQPLELSQWAKEIGQFPKINCVRDESIICGKDGVEEYKIEKKEVS